jgi:group I intron endonuclease
MGYLYLAKNNTTGKMYVGKTTRDFNRRIAEHMRDASKGSTTPFHEALREYGPEAFTFEIVECEDNILSNAEATLIKQNTNGYNNHTPSVSGCFIGAKIDEEMKDMYNKVVDSISGDRNKLIVGYGLEFISEFLEGDKDLTNYMMNRKDYILPPAEKTIQ